MKYKHFNLSNRIELSILLKKGYSFRDIGPVLEKNPSSISREINTNSVNGTYDPFKAQHKAYVKRKYSKYQGMKIRENDELETYIQEKLKLRWSPEQIAGRVKLINNEKTVVSTKSIYKYLYSAFGQKLCPYLPSKRYSRKRRKMKKTKRVMIPNRVLIDNRPKIVDKRTTFGHWEGDTLGRIKSDKQVIAGAVERKSRYLKLIKLPELKCTIDGFKTILSPYHNTIRSLTLDNGVENIRYEKLNIPTFFCHPYSSWEKGTIEHCFKRLRRFIPKKTSLSNFTKQDIYVIVDLMNNTPRKCLKWKTPKEVFDYELSKQGVALQG